MIPTISILAAFVTPALATAGLAAMAAPILIHLLARRRFRRIRWAAMDFLIDAEKRNRRRIQMEDWILMALRCLAVALIGFLVARPFFSPTGLAAWGGAQRTERVLVIDDSFSMGYQTGETAVFDRAKQAARRIVQTVHEENPDDTLTLLRTSAPDKPVVAGAYLETAQKDDVLARLEAMSVSHRSMDLPGVFEGVVDALRRDTSILSAAVYLFSDFQRVDWARPGGTGGPSNLAEALQQWAGEDRTLRTFFVNIGEDDAANAAATALSLPSGQVVAGTEGLLRAGVANYSSRPLDDVAVRLTVGNQPEITKSVPSVAERQNAAVDFEGSFLRAGDESVRLDLPADSLLLDNTRYLAVQVVTALRVLVVDGEPSADDFDDEVALLATALRPEGEVFSGYEVSIVNESGMDEASLGQFHVVVLANVFRLSEPAVESLEHYARQGGGVLMFLGDQIDADTFNTTFFRGGQGLAPAELIEVVRPGSPARLVVKNRIHPALRGIGREDDPLGLGQVPFYTFFAAKPLADREAGAAPAASEVSEPAVPRLDAATVLASFDVPEEHPAIVERTYGAGRVLLVASSADKEWNLWPDHPTYLPVMLELTGHLARSGRAGREQWAGSPIETQVDPSTYLPEVTVRPPRFPNEPEGFITALPDESGLGLVARWDQTESVGMYQFVLKRQDGGEHVRLAAVNTDPRESDLAMADEAELRRSMGTLRFEYVRGLEALASGSDEGRTEIWPLCLFLAVTLLMSEQFLAWRWGRRR